MKNQRGFALIYLIIAGAAVIACWYAYQTIDKRAYARAKGEVESAYAKRDNDALRAANAQIQALQTAARKKEADHSAQVVEISTKYQKDIANGKAKVAIIERSILDGAIRLRAPYAATCPSASSTGSAGETGAGTSGRNDSERSGFSLETSRFLVGEANRADEVVRQLTACQAVVVSDRK